MKLLYFIFPSTTILMACLRGLILLVLLLLLVILVGIVVSDEIWLRGLYVSNNLDVR